MHPRLIVLIACCTTIGQGQTAVAVEPPTQNDIRFFETRIRPLLADNCFRCHGPDKQRGDLRLDSAQAIRRGGSSALPIVTPAQPEKSLLLKAVRHEDDDLKMPPGKKLTDQQIADLTRWVEAGGYFPEPVARAANQEHWAFQPPQDPPLPAVRQTEWARTPLDRFILAALEEKQLRPAVAADRRTLIRRATFDLLGLPPTPEEIEAFVNDATPDAFRKVVDRLLASPHYGERWARHWLDVARYADSNGLDENIAFGNAWRYRDYVVAAFNKDKPYDQFLMEQIAGDLLPADNDTARREQLVATSFLALGPKVLAEVDAKKMEMDILDEQVDTFGRSVLALTMGCARCHNHKFDPLTMEDYYGLVGIFQSSKSMEHYTKIARWHENSVASDQDVAKKKVSDDSIARLKSSVKDVIGKANNELLRTHKELPKNAEQLYSENARTELKKLRDELAALEKTAFELPSSLGLTEGKVGNAVLLRRGNHLTPGSAVPRRFPAILTELQPQLPPDRSGRLELARWLVRKDHPLTGRVMVNRLWRWHFGQGIVASTDNFGELGDRPSNQPLLDWLAHRFVENGWSLKAMHRLIMLSNTYQMSSTFDAKSAEIDPDNRLHWRANIRRLEAEAIRDNILAVSGLLDRTMGGSLLHVKNRAFLFDHTSRDGTKYDSRRRTLYLPVIRNNLYDVFQLFDATDGTVINGDRASTTVATQALFVMNSELIADATRRLATDLLAATGDDAARVRRLVSQAYGRPATEVEVARALVALREFDKESSGSDAATKRVQAWTLLCHVVMAANEFVYVN